MSLAVALTLALESAVTVATTGQAVALPAHTSASAPQTRSPAAVTEATDTDSARVAARLAGKRVEVLSERTESSTTWANPDGTVTVDTFGGPVRYEDDLSGAWRDIDVALVQRRNGVVEAAAHPLGLTLAGRTSAADAARIEASGGEPGEPKTPAVPLVSLDDGAGKELTVSWRGELPAPTVVDTHARYADAMPFTDLIVESTRTGFEQFLELKDRRAVEANGSVTLTLSTKGLDVRANEDRSVSFLDSDSGEQVGVLPAPVMWDARTDPRSGDPYRTAEVGLTVSQRGDDVDLTLTPDQDFLTAPDTTFPVTVDPAVNIGPSFDAFVQQGYTTDQSASTELKLGNNGSGQAARSFLAFPMASVTGKNITQAKLNLWNFHSWSCAARSWEVWDTGSVSASARWTAQPAWRKKWADTTSTKGYSSGCADGWVSQDITGLAQSWAANGNATNTLGIRATDESDPYGWKKFNSADAASNIPYLSVTYTSLASVPTGQAITPSLVNAYNGKRYVTSLTPQVSAKVSHAGGGSVKAQFEITPDPAYNDAGGYSYTVTSANVASGGNAKITVPADKAFPAGSHLRYRVRGYDGALYGPWTGYTVFVLNTAKPAAPGISCDTYQRDTWSAKAEDSTKCTFTTTSSDGQGYLWGLDDPATPKRVDDTIAGSGGKPLTVTVKPGDGWHTLYARTVDSGGNLSTATTQYSFGVGADGAALLSPSEGDRSARRVALSAKGRTDYTGVAYQYRRGETDTWKNVPSSDVKKASDGSAVAGWPLAISGGITPALTWDVTATLAEDGPIDVRASFVKGSTTGYSQPSTVTVDRRAGTAPAERLGPGTLNLLTGDYTLSITDVSAFGMTVSRSVSSRHPSAVEEGQAAIFGKEWTAGRILGDSEVSWSQVKKTSAVSVALVDISGQSRGFTATGTGGWRPEPGSSELTLTGSLTGSFTLRDTEGTVTVFSRTDSKATTWQATSTTQDGLAVSTTTVIPEAAGTNGLTRPKRIVASTSAVPAATCAGAPATRGCRVLDFVYATTTTATDDSPGDHAGQVTEIRLWSTAPGASAATSEPVQRYLYDRAGRLFETWQPKVSPPLKTRYGYDADGRVTTLTQAGELPWTFAYGRAGHTDVAGDGMLLKMSRPGLRGGTADVVEGISETSVVYDVPVTGAGAPYPMGPSDVRAWGQSDAPTDATALLPPDAVPPHHTGSALSAGDYERAAITYVNASGREVNSAVPGGHITAAEYDRHGNSVRTLSAANRALALALTADDRATLADLGIAALPTAERAELLSARSTYDESGTRGLEVFGPLRRIELTEPLKSGTTTLLPAGTSVAARNWTVSTYDAGRPTDGSATVEDQVTRATSGAQLLDSPALMAEARVTETVYDWVKGLPVKTIEDPAGLALTTITSYDEQGRAVKEQLPGADGNDAATQLTTYWSATGTGNCAGRPEWADLPCSTYAAAPITGGGSNPSGQPVTTSAYDWWGNTTRTQETVGGVTRVTETGYDAAGRAISLKTSGGSGRSVPETTITYDPGNGQPFRTVSPTGGTITQRYDALGRLISYTDADDGTTRTEYDALDRPVKVSDSIPSTVTYSYDHRAEPRGMAVRSTDSVAGVFTAQYDADGSVVREGLPGGYTLTQKEDPAGAVVSRVYVRDSDSVGVMADSVTRSIHGEVVGHDGWSSQTFGYDRTGRLATVEDTVGDVCTRRTYTFDRSANRTSLTSASGGVGADCPTSAGTRRTHSYDSGNRLVDAGYGYDAFGRTTTLPGSRIDYFANDLVHQQTTAGARQTWTLDAHHRARSWTVESSTENGWETTGSKRNHYDGDGDSPRWIVEDTGTGALTRIVDSAAGEFSATTGADGGTVLQLTGIHGDIGLQLPLDPAEAPQVLDNDEYGNARLGQAAPRYGWLGAKQRSSETLTGLTMLGVRLYNPATGRFLSVDPDPDGGSNAYVYCSGDAVNCRDTTGLLDYSFEFQLGLGKAKAKSLFKHWMKNFGKIFPLKGRAKKITHVGQKMDLRDSIAGFGSINFNVRVASIGARRLRLDARKGSVVYGRNSYIAFRIHKPKKDSKGFGQLYLIVHGHTEGDTWADRWIPGFMYRKGAYSTWDKLASNLRRQVW
ncbi:DNRLRE domain-containing protein [Streptomyces paludis]|uniref:RHS repeat protein n=1 Tax=Streptomyces paludis TaxID=2282738 RepID=A0A345HLT5_9ACTN|nr:DNRLRE domain-containing protein [Streptomyces paludis]AXG77659.1 RHS repeat protein [Streptomyces paludis]